MSKHWVDAGDLAGLLGPFLGDPRQGFGSDGKILSDRRHSGSRARRVLDPPGSGEGRDRTTWWTRPRSRFRGVVDAPRPTRSMAKGCCARCWRSSGASRGCVRWCGFPCRRTRSPPDLSRAPDADRRADTACQSDQRPAVFSGIGDYEPLRRDRRRALEAARTGDGRALGANMKAQIGRELDRLELLLGQMAAIEAERDAMLASRSRPRRSRAPRRAGARAEADGPERPGRRNRA